MGIKNKLQEMLGTNLIKARDEKQYGVGFGVEG